MKKDTEKKPEDESYHGKGPKQAMTGKKAKMGKARGKPKGKAC